MTVIPKENMMALKSISMDAESIEIDCLGVQLIIKVVRPDGGTTSINVFAGNHIIGATIVSHTEADEDEGGAI